MNPHKVLDTSYRERRRILRLLDFLGRDQLTRDQMERIGKRLQKSGKRALPPLVRRLWKERDRERLFRYTCMLEFFDASTWMDQLVNLTIKRQDLPDDDRLPLLEILHIYGVDVTSPPFTRQGDKPGLSTFLENCLTDADWGMVYFMDYFLDAPEPLREQMVKRLGAERENCEAAAAILYMLAHFEYQEIAQLAVDSLGMLRHGTALTVLNKLCHLAVEGLEPRITRSRRRLNFLGINEPLPLSGCHATPNRLSAVQGRAFDAHGTSTIWFSWELPDNRYTSLLLQVSEHEGVIQAMTNHFDNLLAHNEYLDEINAVESLFPIEFDYALQLIKDAALRSIEHNYYLPPDFYAARHLFGSNDLRPKVYLPYFDPALLNSISNRIGFDTVNSDSLLAEPFFENWLVYASQLFDVAEKLGEKGIDGCSTEKQQELVEQLCKELIEPDKAGFVRRLLLVADFIQQLGCHQTIVRRVLAVSLSLSSVTRPLSRHPFVRRLLLDSLAAACSSLADGIDPRQQQAFDDDGDWV